MTNYYSITIEQGKLSRKVVCQFSPKSPPRVGDEVNIKGVESPWYVTKVKRLTEEPFFVDFGKAKSKVSV